MKAANYLQTKLESAGQYSLTDVEKSLLKKEGVENFLFKKITSGKFRKWSISPEAQQQIKNIIHHQVIQQLPIVFTFPFGGYKLWRLPTAPDVDWAEFFSVAYCLEFLSPVAAAYQPGFKLLFTSDEVIIERMNNVSKKQTDIYTQSFEKLIQKFQEYLPNNVRLEFISIRDLYKTNPAELETELTKNFKKQQQLWPVQTTDRKKARFAMSKLNIKMHGYEPWHMLSQKEQNAKIIAGAQFHDAYIQLKRRVDMVKGPNKIILFCFPIPGIPCIPIGSTKASVNKFWTGTGVLEKKGQTFREIILSPTQLHKVADKKFKTENSDLLPLKNLKTVTIYQEDINFSYQQ